MFVYKTPLNRRTEPRPATAVVNPHQQIANQVKCILNDPATQRESHRIPFALIYWYSATIKTIFSAIATPYFRILQY